MNDDILHLFRKFAAGKCTSAELEQVRALIASQSHAEEWQAVIKEQADAINNSDLDDFGDHDFAQVELYGRIKNTIGFEERRRVRPLWPRIAAVASVLVILSAGGYFLLHKKQPVQQVVQNQIHDAKPGGNKAILTLAGGKQVILTSANIGVIAQQGNAAVTKTASGQIVYNAVAAPVDAAKAPEIVMHTITTPRGGKWFVALSDGTKVWLNAASSITYPTAFTGNERKVTITGEAYFEVVHNAARPFRVIANGETIEDIGTSFNVNAYSDEPDTKTTLVEGSVKIASPTGSALLKPGQQAVIKPGAAIAVTTDRDMAQTLAWKNGLFVFNHTDLHTAMRQLSRWYDMDIVYEPGVDDKTFFGQINQDNNLSDILKVLELGGLHFRIDGKKLVVLP